MLESRMATEQAPADPPLRDAFGTQVQWCRRLGAPFTARVIELLAEDWAAGGIVRALLPGWAGNPWDDAVALRLAGALHALVLQGRDEALTACYADQRLDGERDFALRRAVLGALRRHPDVADRWLAQPPQTNEVGRSAALLGGFALIARHTALPLALWEIGASAGLNLLWDRYRYRLSPGAAASIGSQAPPLAPTTPLPQPPSPASGAAAASAPGAAGTGVADSAITWGDPASPLLIETDWRGNAPILPNRIEVVSRAGCDVAPIDVRDPAQAIRLQSYTWADQRVRLLRLRAAIALAQRDPPPLAQDNALDWLREQWAGAPREGCVTVLYHSLVWQYLGDRQRQGIRALMDEMGARASLRAPLAWLRVEPFPDGGPELKLTLWPGGERRVLADVHPHGASIDWH